MLRRLCGVLLLLFALAPGLHAQDAAWTALIYNGAQIQVLTADGLVEPLPIPAEAQNIRPYHSLGSISLSPDRAYLVFSDSQGAGGGNIPDATLSIADLTGQTCCLRVESPLAASADTIIVGPFSPDGTQVAVIFASVYSGALESRLAVVDVATGTVVNSVSMLDQFGDLGLFFKGWTEAGIEGALTCLACGGALDGYTLIWDPQTGTVTRDAHYFNHAGSRLGNTGEYVIPARDESLPVSAADGMIPPQNVIRYLPDGRPQNATLLYHDPANLTIGGVAWVLDGEAYLLTSWENTDAVLVYRDGRTQVLTMPGPGQVLDGLPNGWIWFSYADNSLSAYQLAGDQLTVTPLGAGDTSVILAAPLLGSDSLPVPFTVIR